MKRLGNSMTAILALAMALGLPSAGNAAAKEAKPKAPGKAAVAAPPAPPAGAPTTAAAAPVAAGKKMSAGTGKVEFLAIGSPSFLKVRGKSPAAPKGELTMNDDKASGEFTFDLTSLDTENEMRNDHMKNKYLQVAQFPTATIKFKDVDAKGDSVKATIPAELTLHGKTKPIQLVAELTKAGATAKAKGEFKFKLSEYSIDIPKHMGITVADEVTVNIESDLK